MSFDLTILPNKIEKLKKSFESGEFADALLGAVNTGNALMQQRVFSENVDTQGNSFGQYIGKKRTVKTFTKTTNATQNKRGKALIGKSLTPYEIKRAAAGRQTTRKDLEFTGGLRRAIETAVVNEKAVVIEFNNSEAVLIALGQEAQITNIRNGQKGTTKGTGIKIFRLSKTEREEVVGQGLELINQIMKR